MRGQERTANASLLRSLTFLRLHFPKIPPWKGKRNYSIYSSSRYLKVVCPPYSPQVMTVKPCAPIDRKRPYSRPRSGPG
jgi:hypothetical protein